MNLRYRLWRSRYGIDSVPGEDGTLPWWYIRTRYLVEPTDVGGRRWNWRVWLEFQNRSPKDWQDWHCDCSMYTPGNKRKPNSSEVRGTERTQDAAERRARDAIDDVRRRLAAGETLRNAREAAGVGEVVDL